MRSSPLASRTSIAAAFALVSAAQSQTIAGGRFYNGSGAVGAASYELVDGYNPANGYSAFFDKFYFDTSGDQTYGHVVYVNESVAKANGFASITSNNTAKIIPDTTNLWPRGGTGRPSVRLHSNNTYTHGLFIADFKHLPWGCGTWPAFWLYGEGITWPGNGEIDIIEGVNTIVTDAVTLHTEAGCTIVGNDQTGTFGGGNCDSSSGGNGCGSTLSNVTIPDNYGDEFNSVEGGVYAMEWTSSYIKTWFFRRGSIPADITSGNPVPDSTAWGTPAVNAQGDCTIDNYFNNMSIIMNIDFCGAWAGEVYESQYPSCPQNASAGGSLNSCVDFVGNNPTYFEQAYFEVNYINVYQMPENAVAISTYSTSLTSVTPSTSITINVAMGSSTSVSSVAYTGPISSTCAGISNGTCTVTATSTSTTTTSIPITSTSSTPSASTLSCPAANGTTNEDSTGNNYTIYCGYESTAGSLTGSATDFASGDYTTCETYCSGYTGCAAFTWVPDPTGGGQCWVKGSGGYLVSSQSSYIGGFLNNSVATTSSSSRSSSSSSSGSSTTSATSASSSASAAASITTSSTSSVSSATSSMSASTTSPSASASSLTTSTAASTTPSSSSQSATSTSAIPAAQTSLSCPAANNTILSDTQGNEYILLCGIATDGDASFNSSYVDSISDCVDSCGNNTGCVNAEFMEGSGACYFKATYHNPIAADSEDTVVLLSAYNSSSGSLSVTGTPTASGTSVAPSRSTLSSVSSVSSTSLTATSGVSVVSIYSTASDGSTSLISTYTTAVEASSSSTVSSTITSASSSTSTTSLSTVTYGYTYYSTMSNGSVATETGTATLTSSASACPTATADACSSDGAPTACTDDSGTTYAVQCGVAYQGTTLNPSSSSSSSKRQPVQPIMVIKRQTVEHTYTDCEELCDDNPQCDAFNYQGDECTLIANVTGTTSEPGAVAGTSIASDAPAATSTSSSSTTLMPLAGINATLTSAASATGIGSLGNATCSPQCPGSAGQSCSDSGGMTYTIGCAVSFAGGDLTNFPGKSFADCLPTCDAMSACVGVEFDTSTMTCYLKSSFNGTQTLDNDVVYGINIRATAPVVTIGASTMTLSLTSGATVTVVPTTTLTSTMPSGGTFSTSSTNTYYVYNTTSLTSSGTIPMTSPSVCLCYTCALTPTVVDASYCSSTTSGSGTSPNTNTALPTTTDGNCRALSGTGYTTVYTTYTVTTCDAQPTCPASGYLIGNGATGASVSVVTTTNSAGSSITYTQIPTISNARTGATGTGWSTAASTATITSAAGTTSVVETLTISGTTTTVTGSTTQPTCPYSEGELYTDKYGESYYVQCNQAYAAPQPSGISARQEGADDASTLSVTSAGSLGDCIAACDFYSLQTFDDITYCLGVTWYDNTNSSNCLLKNAVNSTTYAADAHSAFLTVNRVAVRGDNVTTTVSGDGTNPGVTATVISGSGGAGTTPGITATAATTIVSTYASGGVIYYSTVQGNGTNADVTATATLGGGSGGTGTSGSSGGTNPGVTATSVLTSVLLSTGAGTGPGTGAGTGVVTVAGSGTNVGVTATVAGLGTNAVVTATGMSSATVVSTAISVSEVASTVYGTSTAVSTYVTGGTTYVSTYGVSTALSVVYSANTVTQTTTTVSVSVSTAISVSVSVSSAPGGTVTTGGGGSGVVTLTQGSGGSGVVTVTAEPVTVISYVQASSSSSSFTCRTSATNYLNGAHGKAKRTGVRRSIWDWNENLAAAGTLPQPGAVPKPWAAADRGRM